MVSFDLRTAATAEGEWGSSARWLGAPPLRLDGVGNAVVAAHPDDETLGAGGLLSDLHENGVGITVVLATRGGRSHPTDVSTRRESEFCAAPTIPYQTVNAPSSLCKTGDLPRIPTRFAMVLRGPPHLLI